ncbi:hypothetical protein CKO51_01835 [Rhodopirellula sp. SM50]|nr:LamG-like jellyroll fold domain-containing protein [Rhodopirellula sp. SM50]PAY21344.1 hypothetical protein CKO51_01835 [Rhodopirellula sp. SM50]
MRIHSWFGRAAAHDKSRVRQRNRRVARRMLTETLEERHLLAVTPLSPGETAALRDTVSAVQSFGDRLDQYAAFAQSLPMIEATLGEQIDIGGAFGQSFVRTIQSFLDAPNPTKEGLETKVGTTLGDRGTIDSSISPTEISFTIDASVERSIKTEFDLSEHIPNSSMIIADKLEAELKLKLDFNFTFGIDRTATSATAGAFISFDDDAEQNKLSASLSFAPNVAPLAANLGVLGITLEDPTASVSLMASFDTITEKVSPSQLLTSELSSLVKITTPNAPDNEFSLELDVKTTLEGIDAADAKVTITDSLFDSNPPTISVDVGALSSFRALSPTGLLSALDQASNTLGGLNAFDTIIPFTDGKKLSETIKLADAFESKVIQPATDSQQEGQPGFSSLQQFVVKVADGVQFVLPDANDPNPVNEIVLDFSFEHVFDIAAFEMDFGEGLGDLIGIELDASTRLNVSADVGADFQLGIKLIQPGASFGFDDSTLLSALNGGRGVPSVAGLPDFKVTLRSGKSKEIDLSDITTVGQLISALSTGNLDELKVGFQTATDPVTGDEFSEGLTLIDPTTGTENSKLKIEILNGSLAAASLGLLGFGAAGIFTGTDGKIDDVKHGMMTGQLHGESIADNLYIKQREENNEKLPMFSAGAQLTAGLDGSAKLGFIEVGIANATAVGLVSVDFTPPDPDGNGEISGGEIIEIAGSLGREITAPKPVDFGQAADYSGAVEIVFQKTDDSTATLSIPFIVRATDDAGKIETIARAMNASLDGSSDPNAARIRVGSAMGMLTFTLTDRSDLQKMTVKGGGANQNIVLLGLTEDTSVYVLRPEFGGSAHFDIPLTLSVGGLTLPEGIGGKTLTFDVPDLFNIDLNLKDALDIDFSEMGDDLKRLKDLDPSAIFDAINGAFEMLKGLEAFQDAAFLNEPLPLLGTDLKSVLDLAATFGELIVDLKNDPVDAVGQIDDHLERLLGITNDEAVELSFDTSGDNPALRIDLLLTVDAGGIGFGTVDPLVFETPVSIDLADLGSNDFSNLIDAKGSAALSLMGFAELDISIGIELPDSGNPIPFLYDFDDMDDEDPSNDTGTNLALLVKADASDINFNVAIGPIGASIVQQPGQSLSISGPAGPGEEYARFVVELTDVAEGDDGRHLLSELALTGPNRLSRDDFGFSGDGSVAFDADLDFAGLPTFPVSFALNNIGSLTDPGGLQPDDFHFTVNGVSADQALGGVKDILAGDFDLLSFVGGWDGAFDLIIDAMEGEVFGLELPFIGDKLKDQADFLREIKDSVSANLGDNVENEEGGVFTEIFDDIRQDILDGIGPGGVNLLKDLTNDGQVTIDDVVIGLIEPGPGVEFEILIGSDLGKLDLPFGFDLGIPGLGLEVNAEVEASLGFEFGLSMGVDLDHGFFIDTNDSFLQVFVDVAIPNLNATGELGFLRLDANLLADRGEQAKAMAMVGRDQPLDSQFEIFSNQRGSTANFDVRIIPDDGQGENWKFDAADRMLTFEVESTTSAAELVLRINDTPELAAHFSAVLAEENGLGGGVVDANQRALGVANSFVGQFTVDLIDPALDGEADGKLSFNEIVSVQSFDQVLNIDILAKAALDMHLHAGFGENANFPSIQTGMSVDWEFQLGDDVQLPTVQFVNIELGLGEFLSGFAGGMFEQVEKVLAPVRPIVNFLSEELPVVSELTGGPITVLDLIRMQGGRVARAASFIEAVQKLDSIISNIPDLGDAMLPIGNATFDPNKETDRFTIDGGLVDAFSAMKDAFSAKAPAEGGFDPNNFVASEEDLDEMGDDKLKLGFPILSPANVLGLLGGEVVDLFTLELPTLTLDASIKKFFPLPPFPAVGIELAGNFEAKADFAFGFDTLGIEQFKQSGDFEDIINGFFVFDHENADGSGEDIPELVLGASVTAAAALNVGILSASVGGGIFANVDFNLHDEDDDGKIRLVELLDSVLLGPIHIFDVSGSFDAKLFATVTIDLGVVEIDKSFDLAEVNLFKFDIPRPDGTFAPLAELQGSNLVLNIGDRAGQRDPTGLFGIGTEQAIDYRILAGPAPGEIVVESFGRSQTYQNVAQITGAAGQFDDKISVSEDVTIPVTLSGGDGNDLLIGGSGNDSLSGGPGMDELRGGAGTDLLDGGAGRDNLMGEGGDDELHGGADADELRGGDGDDIARGDGGDDQIFGGGGDDDLSGGAGFDTLLGEGGSDTIDGGDDGDEIQGGDGGDVIWGGSGSDQIFAGGGNDIVHAGTGDDVVFGGIGNDTLFGEEDDDQLFGENSRDTLYGGPGNDLLEGGFASDDLFGGLGDDELFANTSDTSVVDEATHLLVGGGGDDLISAVFPTCDLADLDCSFDNTVFGDGANDEAGNVDPALDGNDIIRTGDGNDTIHAGGGNDQVFASLGIDMDAADADWVDAGSGNDVVFTGQGNDYVIGGFGDDELFGQTGIDVIWGGLQPEGVTRDSFFIRDENDAFPLITDNFELPPRYLQAEAAYPTGYMPPMITPKFTLGQPVEGTAGGGDDKIEGGDGTDFLFGGAGVDIILGGAGSDYIDAGAGNDINVRGGDGDDVVRGGGNNDELNGDAGIDQILGDGGDDKLYGDVGTAGVQLGQRLFGGDGGDILYAYADGINQNASQNVLDGDQLFGDAAGDTLYGSLRKELLVGGAGADFLIGDALLGSDYRKNPAADTTGADDRLFGETGEDRLFGGGGDDEMWGGGDTDYFDGQKGDDTQYGGSGNDLFVVSAMKVQQDGTDVIDGHFGNFPGDNSVDDSTDVMVINGSQLHDTIALSQEIAASKRLRIDYKSGMSASRTIFVDWLDSSGSPVIQQFQVAGLAGNDLIGFAGVHPTLLPLQPIGAEALDLTALVNRSSEAVSTIEGNSGNDTVIGSIAGDLINGGPGSDTMFGFAGDDSLGGDNLDGFVGDRDVMYAGGGNDDLTAGQGTNELYAWSIDPRIADFGIYVDSDGSFHDDSAGGTRSQENTGLNRMLGGVLADQLYGGTVLDFMYGQGGGDTLYRADGTTFESLGNAIPGNEWKDYARETGQVWYVGGTNADDEISVNFVTEPGLLSDHHLITRLTDNGDNFTFDAQVRLDFSATDADGNLIWSPDQIQFDYEALRDAEEALDPTSEIADVLERTAQEARTSLIENLLPPEGDFLAIIVDALDGNDEIIVGPTVQKSVWIDAGAGDDQVTIRGGKAILADRAESSLSADGLTSRNDLPRHAFEVDLHDTGLRLDNLTIDNANDVDWFSFTMPQSMHTLSIEIASASPADEFSFRIYPPSRATDNNVAAITDLSTLAAGDVYLLEVFNDLTPTIYGIEFILDPMGPPQRVDLGLRVDLVRRDLILGGPGHDQLLGGPGADWIIGGPGNDVISGGRDRMASDLLLGGDGDDTFQIIPDQLPEVGNEPDSVFDSVTQTYRPTANDLIDGGSGNDRMLYVGGDLDRLGNPVPDYAAIRYNTGLHRYEFSSLVWDIGTQSYQMEIDASGITQWKQHFLFYQTHNIEDTQFELRDGDDTLHADPEFKYVPAHLSESWVHRYSFDEPTGVFVDSVGGADANLVDLPGGGDSEVTGGQVRLFGGAHATSDYVELPDTLFDGLTSTTIELWATRESVQSWSRIFDFGPSPYFLATWDAAGNGDRELVQWTNDLYDSLAPYVDGQETHLAIAVEQGAGAGGSTRVSLYRDGVFKGVFHTANTLATLNDNNWLGRSKFTNDLTADASYNEFRIHNRALTPEEVASSYSIGADAPGTGEEWGIKLGDFQQGATEAQLIVSGGNGDDELFGGALADWIEGGPGHDLIVGGSGNDELLGGSGDDQIFGLKESVVPRPPSGVSGHSSLGASEAYEYSLVPPFFALPQTRLAGLDLHSLESQTEPLNLSLSPEVVGLDGVSVRERLSELRPIGDFNADGREDFLAVSDTTSYVLLGPVELDAIERVDQFAEIVIDHAALGRPAERFGDINGDGNADLAFVRDEDGVTLATVVLGGAKMNDTQDWPRLWDDNLATAGTSFRSIDLTGMPLSSEVPVEVSIAEITGDAYDDLVILAGSTAEEKHDVGAFIRTSPARGRFVRIKNMGDLPRELHLAEVEVFPCDVTPAGDCGFTPTPGVYDQNDLARQFKGARIFSKVGEQFFAHTQDATTLLDGGPQSGNAVYTVTGIGNEVVIDLGSTQDIGTIRLWQRSDMGSPQRLSDVEVTVQTGREISNDEYEPDSIVALDHWRGVVPFPNASLEMVVVDEGYWSNGGVVFSGGTISTMQSLEFSDAQTQIVNNPSLFRPLTLSAIAEDSNGDGVNEIVFGNRNTDVGIYQALPAQVTASPPSTSFSGTAPLDIAVNGMATRLRISFEENTAETSETPEPNTAEKLVDQINRKLSDTEFSGRVFATAVDGRIQMTTVQLGEDIRLGVFGAELGFETRTEIERIYAPDDDNRGTLFPQPFDTSEDDEEFYFNIASGQQLGIITDIEITVDITHDFLPNLALRLGKTEDAFSFDESFFVPLAANIGTSTDSFRNTTFSDNAVTHITDFDILNYDNQVFRPLEPLDLFVGTTPGKKIALQVQETDTGGTATGTVHALSLKLTTSFHEFATGSVVPLDVSASSSHFLSLPGVSGPQQVVEAIRFGSSYEPTALTDLNHDGYGDVAFSHPNKLEIYRGSPRNISASDSASLIINGTGLSAASGDFDGDGTTDLAVTQIQNQNQSGAVFLFWAIGDLMASGTMTLDLQDADLEFDGGLESGTSPVFSRMDLNADGMDDLVISAGLARNESGANEAGRLYVVYGASARSAVPTTGLIDLENFSVPGSGSFVVDTNTGRPSEFNDSGQPYALGAADDEQWFRFTTLGDGQATDVIRLLSQPMTTLVADLIDADGASIASNQSVFDLRHLTAGTYYLRVYGSTDPFTIEFDAPQRGFGHGSTTLPDRDLIDGGDGDDTLVGNNDIDRIFGGGGGDTVIGEPFEQRDASPSDASLVVPQVDEQISAEPHVSLDTEIEIGNQAVARAIATQLGQPITVDTDGAFQPLGPFFASQLNTIALLNAAGLGLTTTVGLDRIPNVRHLSLSGNDFTGINELSTLTQLRSLDLSNNPNLTDINALGSLASLQHLYLEGTDVLADTKIAAFSGADPGEGLDLNGDFVYAVNMRGPATTVRGVNFTTDAVTGIGYSATNEILNWQTPDYGTTTDDNNLESIMQSIRWSSTPEPLTVDLANLVPGQRYKLQLLFHEDNPNRGFDIFVEGDLIADDFTAGFTPPEHGAVVAYNFIATDEGLNIELNGQPTLFADKNPVLQGLTLEHIDSQILFDPIPTLSRLTELQTLTLPVAGLSPAGQNLVGSEGTPINLTANNSGVWTVRDPDSATVATGTGTLISFTPSATGVYTITHPDTGAFPFFSQNVAPLIQGLVATNVQQGHTRSDTDFYTGVADAGTTTTQVSITERAIGVVTDLTTGSLEMNDDIVELDSSILNESLDVTVGFWVNANSTDQPFQTIIRGSSARTNSEFEMYLHGSNELFVGIYGNGVDFHFANVGAALKNGTWLNSWNHVAFVRDSGRQQWAFYVNGQEIELVDKQVQQSIQVDADRFFLGNANSLGFNPLEANLDEVGIWRRALNADQIQAIRDNGIVGNEADLAAYFPLNELGGDVVYDRSPNRRNGIVRSVDEATDVTWSTEGGVADQEFVAITPGEYDLVVIAHDEHGASDRAEVLVVVENVAPTARITPDADFTAAVGQTVTLDALASTDPGNDELTFTWTVTTSALPEPGSAAPIATGDTFEFVPSVSGRHTGTLTATDPYGGMSTDTVLVNVNPVAPNLDGQTGLEGDVFLFDASGESAKAADAVRTYAWRVAQGANTIDTGDQYDFAFVPPDDGEYAVELRITDHHAPDLPLTEVEPNNTRPTAQSLEGANWNLQSNAAIPNSTMIPHVSISGRLAPAADFRDLYSFEATQDSQLSFIIDELTTTTNQGYMVLYNATGNAVASNSALTDLTAIAPADGRYYVEVVSWGATFNYALHVSIQNHAANSFVSATSTATVNAANVNSAVEIVGPRIGTEGVQVTLDSIVNDPGSADTFTYLWEIRDEANQLVGLDTANNLESVRFTPTDNGLYTAKLTVTDDDGGATTMTTPIQVLNVNPAVSLVSSVTQIDEQQLGNLVTFTGNFTDVTADNVAQSYVWDFGDGTSDNTTWTPSHVYADSGVYTVTLTVTDKDGGVGTASATVTINNLAPSNLTLTGPTQSNEDTAVVFTGTVSDLNGLNNSSIDLEPLRGTIDFGDGVKLPLLLIRTAATGDYTFTSRHIFADPGTYDVTVEVRDDEGGKTSASHSIAITDNTPPRVIADAISPDPRNAAVDQISLDFGETVSGFERSDLALALDGGANLLSGSAATLTDNGNGVWTLGGLAGLTTGEGDYKLSLHAASSGITDAVNLGLASNLSLVWTMDTTAPTVIVDPLTTSSGSPRLTGTVDDSAAMISVTVNETTYDAVNLGDGTWRLPKDTIATLPDGDYDVMVTATDPATNQGTDATTGELTVASEIETLVSLDASGNLIIKDIVTDNADRLTIRRDAANLVVSDVSAKPLLLGTDIVGATGDATSSITVPLNLISGAIRVNIDAVNKTLADEVLIDFASGGFFAVPGGFDVVGVGEQANKLTVTGTGNTGAVYSTAVVPLGQTQVTVSEAGESNTIRYSQFKTLAFDGLATFVSTSTLNVGSGSLTIGSTTPVDLSSLTMIGGGTLTADRTTLGAAETLTGRGTVATRLTGQADSLILANGTLSIGNQNATDGFQTDGEIRVGKRNVTLRDADVAELGPLTTLGENGHPGLLAATGGFLIDAGRNVTGFGTLDAKNDVALLSVINGSVSGKRAFERVTLEGYITGTGSYNNVLFAGDSTHSPGLSAAVTNHGEVGYADDSKIELEIGGTADGQFDQLRHSGSVSLNGDLVVSLLGAFVPQEGDFFTLIMADGGVEDAFDTATLPVLPDGLAWDLIYSANEVRLEVFSVPFVENVVINGGSASRSSLTSIEVTFSAEVQQSSLVGAFGIRNVETGLDVGQVNVVTNNQGGRTIATLSFAGQSTTGSSLADGNYRLTIGSTNVRDSVSGRAMSDNFVFGRPLSGEPQSDGFFRFYGDTDGDRDVDGQDYGRFGLSFLKSSGDQAYNPDLDSDGDGDVDGQDYGRFGLNFLRRL